MLHYHLTWSTSWPPALGSGLDIARPSTFAIDWRHPRTVYSTALHLVNDARSNRDPMKESQDHRRGASFPPSRCIVTTRSYCTREWCLVIRSSIGWLCWCQVQWQALYDLVIRWAAWQWVHISTFPAHQWVAWQTCGWTSAQSGQWQTWLGPSCVCFFGLRQFFATLSRSDVSCCCCCYLKFLSLL